MNEYHVWLTEKDARKAFAEWVQNHLYPTRTVGDVVYFSHDLKTGEVLLEMSMPLPHDEDEEDDVDGRA
jgi:hypothetical protein